jgi:hypothetical protein
MHVQKARRRRVFVRPAHRHTAFSAPLPRPRGARPYCGRRLEGFQFKPRAPGARLGGLHDGVRARKPKLHLRRDVKELLMVRRPAWLGMDPRGVATVTDLRLRARSFHPVVTRPVDRCPCCLMWFQLFRPLGPSTHPHTDRTRSQYGKQCTVAELYRYHPGILIYYSFFRHWDGMDRKWDGMLGFEFFLKHSHFARKPLTFQRSGR